jgi:hypothetical protein
MESILKSAPFRPSHLIMTGLDPVIFSTSPKEDARVKHGHDEKRLGSRSLNAFDNQDVGFAGSHTLGSCGLVFR